jgi:hypothetical protein
VDVTAQHPLVTTDDPHLDVDVPRARGVVDEVGLHPFAAADARRLGIAREVLGSIDVDIGPRPRERALVAEPERRLVQRLDRPVAIGAAAPPPEAAAGEHLGVLGAVRGQRVVTRRAPDGGALPPQPVELGREVTRAVHAGTLGRPEGVVVQADLAPGDDEPAHPVRQLGIAHEELVVELAVVRGGVEEVEAAADAAAGEVTRHPEGGDRIGVHVVPEPHPPAVASAGLGELDEPQDREVGHRVQPVDELPVRLEAVRHAGVVRLHLLEEVGHVAPGDGPAARVLRRRASDGLRQRSDPRPEHVELPPELADLLLQLLAAGGHRAYVLLEAVEAPHHREGTRDAAGEARSIGRGCVAGAHAGCSSARAGVDDDEVTVPFSRRATVSGTRAMMRVSKGMSARPVARGSTLTSSHPRARRCSWMRRGEMSV